MYNGIKSSYNVQYYVQCACCLGEELIIHQKLFEKVVNYNNDKLRSLKKGNLKELTNIEIFKIQDMDKHLEILSASVHQDQAHCYYHLNTNIVIITVTLLVLNRD